MKISIIVPVYNEAELIKKCLRALINQDYPKKDYEIIVINDGSTDKTLKAVKKKQILAQKEKISFRIINQRKNRGRIIAREVGAENAKYSNLFFIDSRCITPKGVLAKLRQINYQPLICDFTINYKRSYLDRFNYLLRKKIYFPYFGQEYKSVYITKNNFDKIPKGTGAFFCNKKLFLSSKLDNKTKAASDDPKLLWNIVQKKEILKCSEIKITYLSRTSLKKTLGHTFGRGIIFSDFYLTPKRERFWLYIFPPILILVLTIIFVLLNINYFFYWLVVLSIFLVIISLRIAENIKDFFIVLGALPIFALSFSLGILQGLIFKICGLIKIKEL